MIKVNFIPQNRDAQTILELNNGEIAGIDLLSLNDGVYTNVVEDDNTPFIDSHDLITINKNADNIELTVVWSYTDVLLETEIGHLMPNSIEIPLAFSGKIMPYNIQSIYKG